VRGTLGESKYAGYARRSAPSGLSGPGFDSRRLHQTFGQAVLNIAC